MAGDATTNINYEQLFPLVNLQVQPQRWEALGKRLLNLTRTGITNCVTALVGASPVAVATIANLDEAELRATYEAPPSAAYLALSPQLRTQYDGYVTAFLGGPTTYPFTIGGAGLAPAACATWLCTRTESGPFPALP